MVLKGDAEALASRARHDRRAVAQWGGFWRRESTSMLRES